MGSRRAPTRSNSGNGRSTNGETIDGSSRSSGCSYLSNVRPETRSTFSSVMAQLTEETQPSFETTLKSKAVSEKCNVKFSCVVTGYPTPQLTWYKDDVQLDRYCGLPKYEIFRNGQNHSLHIYNCTVEDAAIYQASAINSKGIVSCSGVLEVGEMNEFKIHQRYFAKLKQKAENRRREAEGKENQEPLRTISPDRTQRKRRSTMEAFLSTPSSTEDEGTEENQQAVAAVTEARLQEATVEEVEEKPVTNGQVVTENGSKGGTYIHDAGHKTFNAHQPKTPFVKKKIKISNCTKVAKADTLGERASEERRAKDETSASAAPTCRDSVPCKGNQEEVMEVETISSPTIVDPKYRNMTEPRQKSAAEKAILVKRPSKGDSVCHVPSQIEQLPVSLSPAALTSEGQTVSGTEDNHVAKHANEAGLRRQEEKLETQKQSPNLNLNMTSTRQSRVASTPLRTTKKDAIKRDVTAMDIDKRSDTSTSVTLGRRDLTSGDTPCEIRAASPERPCEQAGDKPSEKETRPCQKSAPASRHVPQSEVTQARIKKNRNDAPVSLGPPPGQGTLEAQQPRKTPSKRQTTRNDVQTTSVQRGLQAPIGKMTQDILDHSRGSNESHRVLLTDLQKPTFESLDGGANTRECNVSSLALQSQADTAVKTVEGTEILVNEKVEGNEVCKVLMQTESVAPTEKIVEMETEAAAPHEKSRDAVDKDVDVEIVEASSKERNESKVVQENCPELQTLKPNVSENAMPQLPNNPENTQEQSLVFNEIPKPVSKVISIAELLRSQLKALDPTLTYSVPVQEPTPAAPMTCEGLRHDDRQCTVEVKKSTPDSKSEAITDDTPPTNIKAILMEVYLQLHETIEEQIHTPSKTSPPLQAPQKGNEGVVNTGQETGASRLVPSIDCPVVSLTSQDKLPPATAKAEQANRPTSVSNLSGTVSRGSGTTRSSSQESNIMIVKHVQNEPAQGKEVESVKRLTPEIKLNGEPEREITEMNSTVLLDPCDMKEHNTSTSSLQSVQMIPAQSLLNTETQENILQLLQPDSSIVEELSRSESLISPTLEASPLLKRRDCASPIPSATPQELASGARRKILVPKSKSEEAAEAASPVDNQAEKKEVSTQNNKLSTSPVTPSVSPSLSRRSALLQPAGERTSPVERRSPLLNRRKTMLETEASNQQPTEKTNNLKTEEQAKPTEKDKHDPFKAPQVIRKIRAETFSDASGHLKLWCQFFNVLSDSTIKWYKNEEVITQIKRSAGDETQVNLAIVQASCRDFGVYGCSITNEYGMDSTDTLLSAEIIAGMSLREDLGVGEEIEMTPLIFTKGLADCGVWANKLFGRITMQESQIGYGCSHKVWRAKVIYGLEPVYESGDTCIIKIHNPIAYGGKEESNLLERNLDIIKQHCKIQNLAREYCKIFSAEARVLDNFGSSLEVIPVYLMYRPANTVPYATVEADLTGDYQKHSVLDHTGRLDVKTGSEVAQKCCALQHWIFQWTNGNLLLTRLEGVDTKITNVGISVKSTGHQGLSVEGNPKVFEQFVSQHQCNYFCGLLSLRSLKVMDSLLTPTKPKGSRSPLLQRKMAAGSSSPQTGRKAAGSPRLPRKTEQDGTKTPTTQKAADAPTIVKTDTE
ncbi:alpha-protein kinase 3-like [Hippoglossus hippoglossus]|uniref:alpha-protein kinase 3-like n=1 Tax=Hippoglossus hippoglossus TaxID=8267 RepID=UPI00148E7679|nr:alpha-protein kinase 3-like [Hippoglossus hippoglossus]